MDWKRKLQNPFVLAAQGFVVGAIFFLTTNPLQNESQAEASGSQVSQAVERAAS